MYFLNLTLVQFLAVAGSVSAIVVAMYLLDRSRRKLVVSTLRFWVPAETPTAVARKRRIQQPWSLILQLMSMALLVLAMAQLRLGAPAESGRNHVMVLDTSAWMAARSGKGTLMDLARQRARQYLRALPARDRVMLVEAGALVTPATAFETDHRKVEDAIRASEAGATALNLDQALAFARHIQTEEGGRAGEIAYIGPGRVAEAGPAVAAPRNLRVIPISDPVENCGLRKIGARPSNGDRDVWEIYVSAHNYGTLPRTLTLALDFGPPGGAGRMAAGSQALNIPPGGDAEASFEYRAGAGGILGATLLPHDAFPSDDHAELELPAQPSLPVTVYSEQPDLLEPVLGAMPRVAAVYRRPAQYRAGDRGLVILDRFIPPERPTADSIWIDPPAQGSPVPIRTVVTGAPFAKWDSAGAFTQGLRAHDFKLERTSVFEAGPGDISIGEVSEGPVIVARGPAPGQPKIVVFGFHPALTAMRDKLVTPLLFAGLVRWIAPDVLRRREISVGSVGTVKLVLDQEAAPLTSGDVRIVAENGSPVPFTLHDRTLNFFAGSPGMVRVVAGDREYLYSLTLPQLWDRKWIAPAGARQGIPRFAQVFTRSSELWPWLALAGGIGLLVEWLLFGNARWSGRARTSAHLLAGPFLLRRRRMGGVGPMNFEHPLVLLLGLLPVAWAAWEWKFSARHTALLLKAGALAAIVLALAMPRLVVYRSRVAVALVADTSASVTAQDLKFESLFADQVQQRRGRHWLKVIPFARNTRNAAPEERSKGHWELRHTAGAGGHSTDLENAIRDGAASLPAGMVPRVLLVSDGNETLGTVARAIWQAQQLGIPVDTVPLAGHPKPGLLIESVTIPGQVFSGEKFPVEVTLHAPRATAATVDMTAENKAIGSSRVQLAAGENRLRLEASVNTAGAIALAGRIEAPGLGEARFEDAVTLRSPRVLVVSHDPAASEAHLARVLEANQFSIDRAPDGVPEDIGNYQLIVINNWDMQSIPAERKAALEAFVKNGGGLVWISGERNVYVDEKGREEDPLERTLPARLSPPRPPEGTAVVLIIDKSSSMEGRKIELARLAAVGVVENLRPIDSVGVLIFDNSFEWAVPIRQAEDRDSIIRLISGIQPDGGTQIAPALTEAYQKILPVPAIYKHIVLLTDGISEEGDSMTLSRQALANHVTISTVGLGQDVNRGFLEKIASLADGKSYFLSEPSGLEQIVLRDVQEHTGNTAVEKTLKPKVVDQAEILDGVDIENAPSLLGYVRYQPRPASDTILEADHDDPLLVRWQYGLGRAAVFTSDAKNRWAVKWIGWPSFDRLWANIFRDLLPHVAPSETTADFDRASNQLVVDYRLARNVPEPASIPDVYVMGPEGFQAPLQVSKVAAGHYRGRLDIGQQQGLFRVRPVAESPAFPEIGFYRQEDELLEYGNNEPLLRQIAAATGGRFYPAPSRVFDAGGHTVRSLMELWPAFLALAVVLNLLELMLRKWKGLAQMLANVFHPESADSAASGVPHEPGASWQPARPA